MSWKFLRKTQFLTLCDVEKKKIKFLRTRLGSCRWPSPQRVEAKVPSRLRGSAQGPSDRPRTGHPGPTHRPPFALVPRGHEARSVRKACQFGKPAPLPSAPFLGPPPCTARWCLHPSKCRFGKPIY